MKEEKRLYRTRDSRLLSGVCAGIADYFNIDPLVVRILAVVLTIASGGLFGIAYIAMWLIIPEAPDRATPVDVQPEQVTSEIYDQVASCCATKKEETSSPSVEPSYQTGVGAAHVPPVPPKAYEASVSQATSQSYYSGYPSQSSFVYPGSPDAKAGESEDSTSSTEENSTKTPSDGSPNRTAAQAPTVPVGSPIPPEQVPPHVPTPTAPYQQYEGMNSGGVKTALWFGFILLFIGFAALVGNFVTGVQWWQFWPIILVIAGIGYMVIPGKRGKRVEHFVDGIVMFSAGAVLLAMSLDVIRYSSFEPIFLNLWPILIIMVGFFVLANALKLPFLTLCGGLCFVAFCVLGVIWYGIPGNPETIFIFLPFGETSVFTITPSIVLG